MKIDLDSKLFNEISEYCKINNIEDVKKYINELFQKFVTSEIYGEVPLFVKKYKENMVNTERNNVFEKEEHYREVLKELEELREHNRILSEKVDNLDNRDDQEYKPIMSNITNITPVNVHDIEHYEKKVDDNMYKDINSDDIKVVELGKKPKIRILK